MKLRWHTLMHLGSTSPPVIYLRFRTKFHMTGEIRRILMEFAKNYRAHGKRPIVNTEVSMGRKTML